MTVPLYLVESLGTPRNHQALFVLLDSEKSLGQLFHVTGNIQEGMVFESKQTYELPEKSVEYIRQDLLGQVLSSDVEKVVEICKSNPPPAKQFDGPRRIDPKIPLRRCQEWTAETIQLLKANGILRAEQT